MTPLQPLVLSLVLLLPGATAFGAEAKPAAPWRSELYLTAPVNPAAANLTTDKVIQDFSYAGYRRGEVAIPDVGGPVRDVTAAPYSADATGKLDATAAIQAAINDAGQIGGGVVYLPAGTFLLSVAPEASEALLISQPGVVLRGAGRERTFLVNTTFDPMRGKAVIRVKGPDGVRFNASSSIQTPLSSDLLHATTHIPVRDAALFSPGDTVIIRNDITPEWVEEQREPGWSGYEKKIGGIVYRRAVLAVDRKANVIMVDAPVRYALRLRDRARVLRLAARPLAEVGLEDFSVGNVQHPGLTWEIRDTDTPGTSGYVVSGSGFIALEQVRDCWVRRVSSFAPEGNTSTAHLLSGGLQMRNATHVTIKEVSLRRPQYGSRGQGYMFSIFPAQETLLVRCEARFSRHGFSFGTPGSSGNVLHDCVDAETGNATGATGGYRTNGFGSDHHMWFSHANLTDICTAEDSWFEAIYRPYAIKPQHLITATHSVFWNTRGTGSIRDAVVKSEQFGWGYVIGTRGERHGVELTTRATGITDPADHVEGKGRGDSLEPFSLYLDQLHRRLGPSAPAP